LGLTTGIKGLDRLLEGYPEGPVLVEYEHGSGATLLGLTYLKAGLSAGEKVALIAVDVPEKALFKRLLTVGVQDASTLDIKRISSSSPLKAISLLGKQVKAFDRVLFDSLDPLLLFEQHDKYSPKFGVLANKLKKIMLKNRSMMFLASFNPENMEFYEFLEEAFSGVLRLSSSSEGRRMSVIKWPWQPRATVIAYHITREGIKL